MKQPPYLSPEIRQTFQDAHLSSSLSVGDTLTKFVFTVSSTTAKLKHAMRKDSTGNLVSHVSSSSTASQSSSSSDEPSGQEAPVKQDQELTEEQATANSSADTTNITGPARSTSPEVNTIPFPSISTKTDSKLVLDNGLGLRETELKVEIKGTQSSFLRTTSTTHTETSLTHREAPHAVTFPVEPVPPPRIRTRSSSFVRRKPGDTAQEQAPLQDPLVADADTSDPSYEELDVAAPDLPAPETNTSSRCFHPGPCHHGPLDDAMQSMLLDLLTTVSDGEEEGEGEIGDLSFTPGQAEGEDLEDMQEIWDEEEVDFGTALCEYGETSSHVIGPLWRFEAEDGQQEDEEEQEADSAEGSGDDGRLRVSALVKRDTSTKDGVPTYTMVSRQVSHKWSGLLAIVDEEVEEPQVEGEAPDRGDSEDDDAASKIHEFPDSNGSEEAPRLYRPLSGVDWMEEDDDLPDLSDF
ncbi:uncharacterized protein STEHIDRAFT_171378 [Stereum hirsutum FP-91666 SS1]|uniref:uncharacterized protein n=1 Tax=Stereum hirsutum (strain FP-91666) TaxID=721885 RepID=UPI00044492DA|nr:uncharacterized protein STEHIDRAFT_171378 [Stereum hirsutum FP-91666 SS1]EIM82474.1 hypothetical protein STEHIDRAFT_171378 [Stereum hirsutum FP-91666 SS1]